MPKGGWRFVKNEIPQEWIENVMSKMEYFDIIKLHFVNGYNRSKRLKDGCNLDKSNSIRSISKEALSTNNCVFETYKQEIKKEVDP